MTVKLQGMEKIKKGGKSPVGEKISRLILEQGFAKPSDFAEANDINLGTFNDLIYGKTKLVPDSLLKISEKLGVKPWELLRADGEAPSPVRAPVIKVNPDILEAIERGVAQTLAAKDVSPDKQKLFDAIARIDDGLARQILKMIEPILADQSKDSTRRSR